MPDAVHMEDDTRENELEVAGQRFRLPAHRATAAVTAAAGDDAPTWFDSSRHVGRVEAFPSVFGRAYRMGFYTYHQIEPGAFDASLAEQDAIPLYVQHNWDWSERPPIGTGFEASEADVAGEVDDDGGQARGLLIAGAFYDTDDGRSTYYGLADRALREWSIGYLIEEYTVEEDDEAGRTVLHVTRAQLWEASVVLRGANPYTRTLEVAARDAGGITAEDVRQLIREELDAAGAGSPETPQVPTDPFDEFSPDALSKSPSLRAALRAMRQTA